MPFLDDVLVILVFIFCLYCCICLCICICIFDNIQAATDGNNDNFTRFFSSYWPLSLDCVYVRVVFGFVFLTISTDGNNANFARFSEMDLDALCEMSMPLELK